MRIETEVVYRHIIPHGRQHTTSIVKAKYQYSNYSFNTSSGYNQIYRPNMKIFLFTSRFK